MQALDRLLRPRSVAVVGGGVWGANVIRECRKIGYDGEIWPVHPTRAEISGLPAFAKVADLPTAPDAAFLAVNRLKTVEAVRELAEIGAGGAVCLASGFREASAEIGDGANLQQQLLEAAGEMRILGPNCYGIVNCLDGAALWPDQHGAVRVERGVAIISQSSNVAMNITMQRRGLPVAYLAAIGNQAQTSQSELGQAILEDPRVTALGMYIEGIGDVRAFEALAAVSRRLGKPVVALKVGESEQAKAATISHTASIAGSDAGGRALLERLGIGQVSSLSALIETLKLLHVHGPLRSNHLASLSCSGGDASMIADRVAQTRLALPPLNNRQSAQLRAILGSKVALANPLDYHTYIWGNREALSECFCAMLDPTIALTCVLLDFPRVDRCTREAWDDVLAAAHEAARQQISPMALIAMISDNMPEDVAMTMVDCGVVPFAGLDEAITAIEIAVSLGEKILKNDPDPAPILLPIVPERVQVMAEAEAKAALSPYGLNVPMSERASSPEEAARVAAQLGFPVVVKGEGIAHKSEAGAVILNLQNSEAVAAAARGMTAVSFLVEEMHQGSVAELLMGIVVDPAHGYVMTLAAGGVWTELLKDSASLILPVGEEDITRALQGLRIAPILRGYRGKSGVDISAIVAAALALQAYVTDHVGVIAEVEVNPLLCASKGAVAADALMRLAAASDGAGEQ